MDVVTLGAALNGAKSQTEDYVSGHFKEGANILITDNQDGTQTISASGEISSEDTVARAAIDAIKDGTTIDSFADVESALADKVDTVSGKGLSTNDFTDEYKTKVDNSLSTETAASTYQPKGSYATTNDIADMATETWVGQQGFLTSADEVPTVGSSDDGKVLTADYTGGTGSYSWESLPSVDEVPTVTSEDDGKVLKASYSGGVGSYSWQTGGGSGGTSDYTNLSNKPSINSVTLSGNKTTSDLGIDEVPEVGVNDDGKVLKASYSGGVGTYSWQTSSGGGTSDYTQLTNLPQINSTTLTGNKSLSDLGIAAAADIPSVPITEIQKNSTTISPVSGVVNITVPTTAADVSAIPTSAKGTASGVAELDSNGKVPSSQLPSYVDDVIEGYYYNSKFYEDSAHTTEITGTTGKIYVDLSTNKTYRWSGSGYTEISESLALGTTSSTAFRGDYGSTAYTHATDSSRSTTAKSSGLYKIASTAEGHIASLTSVQKSDITALGIPAQDTTYTFNTAYNASTNKAATMADIEKGLLPSYAKKTGNVATTDKVVEAIGKLETKADTNASNILTVADQTKQYNYLDNTATTTTNNNITFTVNADKSVTLTSSQAASSDTYFKLGTYTGDGVTRKLKGAPTGSSTSKWWLYGGNGVDDTGSGVNIINTSDVYIVVKSGQSPNNITFKPMITDSDTITSGLGDYQPYSLPNTKITPELIDLVDSGAKNLFQVTSAALTSGFVKNSDGSITVTYNNNTSDYFTQVIALESDLNLPNGEYVLSGCPNTSDAGVKYRLDVTRSGASALQDTGYGVQFVKEDSAPPVQYRIVVYPNSSLSNVTFKPMICSKAAWDVSQKYVPYRPSYEETVEQVAENKTNILTCLKYSVTNMADNMLDNLASGTITSGNAAAAIAGFSEGGWCTVETIPLNTGTGASERKYQRIFMLTGADGGKMKYRMYTGSWGNWIDLN